jgi:transcriptional regulator GlxA family with amidase domain
LARSPTATSRQWRPETQALKTVRESREVAKACLSALIERMRKTPSDPVPKMELKPLFPGISARAFDRLYSQSVQQSGCLAWSKGGRRSRKQT